MRVRVIQGIDDLASDMKAIAVKAKPKLAKVVATNAREGRDQAKMYARQQHTMHGGTDKHYPNSITAERLLPLAWVYGPDAAKPQGGMSFEFGSRNQPPHLDLARSADVIAIQFGDDVGDVVDGMFW